MQSSISNRARRSFSYKTAYEKKLLEIILIVTVQFLIYPLNVIFYIKMATIVWEEVTGLTFS